MRAIYRKPIVERLLDVIAEADSQNLTIGFIELSIDEWRELRATSGLVYSNAPGCMNMRRATFSGVPLKLKRNKQGNKTQQLRNNATKTQQQRNGER